MRISDGVQTCALPICLFVARKDRALDGRRSPPARQQRGMDVEAAVPGGLKHRLRQEQPIGRHHGDIEVKRSEEHTSELQSLMRISYAVFCLKKKTTETKPKKTNTKEQRTRGITN